MLKLLAATAATAVLVTAPIVVSSGTSDGSPVAVAARHSHDDEPSRAAEAAQPVAEHVVEPEAIPSVSLRPDVEVLGASAEEAEALAEAIESFRAAGLELPDLVVAFHDDGAPCKGHEGLFQPQQLPWQVQICSGLAFVATHELAHAWERANVDDADRDRYLSHRGLESWNSSDATWRERGIEDAAYVVQQNLMAGHVDLESDRWQELTEAYQVITGSVSPVVVGADVS